MKKVITAACILAALMVTWYVYTGGTMNLKAAKKQLLKEAQQAVTQGAAPEEVAALAMKAIDMTQGEHGAELWRLKADWGNMRRNDDIMELEKPKFTYYTAPDNVPLDVNSSKGEIEQADQRVKFIGSVVATYDGRIVKAPVMVYAGKSRELVCPEGADISGADMQGTANRIVWDLNAKQLRGFGNVDMTFSNANLKSPMESSNSQ